MNAKELLRATELIDKGGCARCGVINVVAPIASWELARVYKARLCDNCINEWDRHIWDDADWLAVEEIEDFIKVEFALIVYHGNEQKEGTIHRYRTLQREAYRRLMDKAETWVSLGVPPPAKEK